MNRSSPEGLQPHEKGPRPLKNGARLTPPRILMCEKRRRLTAAMLGGNQCARQRRCYQIQAGVLRQQPKRWKRPLPGPRRGTYLQGRSTSLLEEDLQPLPEREHLQRLRPSLAARPRFWLAPAERCLDDAGPHRLRCAPARHRRRQPRNPGHEAPGGRSVDRHSGGVGISGRGRGEGADCRSAARGRAARAATVGRPEAAGAPRPAAALAQRYLQVAEFPYPPSGCLDAQPALSGAAQS